MMLGWFRVVGGGADLMLPKILPWRCASLVRAPYANLGKVIPASERPGAGVGVGANEVVVAAGVVAAVWVDIGAGVRGGRVEVAAALLAGAVAAGALWAGVVWSVLREVVGISERGHQLSARRRSCSFARARDV
jgi:hypothetical protein